jgi:hypothetical protein
METNRETEAEAVAEGVADVMKLLEAEPESEDREREKLATLVASGKAKEMIGVDLTQDQVKRLNKKDVKKYFKRYETSLSSRLSEAMVKSFLQLSCRLISGLLPVDGDRLLEDLEKDYMVTNELSLMAGRLSLNYGKYMAAVSAAMLAVKNVKPTVVPEEVPKAVAKSELENS